MVQIKQLTCRNQISEESRIFAAFPRGLLMIESTKNLSDLCHSSVAGYHTSLKVERAMSKQCMSAIYLSRRKSRPGSPTCHSRIFAPAIILPHSHPIHSYQFCSNPYHSRCNFAPDAVLLPLQFRSRTISFPRNFAPATILHSQQCTCWELGYKLLNKVM